MKKSTTTKLRLSNLVIIGLAFLAGMMVYFAGAIGYDRVVPHAGAASGAWHQVTVRVGVCDCITIFQPEPSLPGGGTAGDPFVANNTQVSVMVGVSGVGHVTIQDEDGNILAEFDQTVSDPTERIVSVTFPSVGSHKLIVKLNGAEVAANGVSTELYFNIGRLPPLIPDLNLPGVPKTGIYVYIAGYAVQVYSLLISGVIGAVAAYFILKAHRRRQARNLTAVRVFIKKPRRKSHRKTVKKRR
jgi:hypothetical protein